MSLLSLGSLSGALHCSVCRLWWPVGRCREVTRKCRHHSLPTGEISQLEQRRPTSPIANPPVPTPCALCLSPGHLECGQIYALSPQHHLCCIPGSRASLNVIFPEVQIRKVAEIGLIPGRVGIGVMIRVCVCGTFQDVGQCFYDNTNCCVKNISAVHIAKPKSYNGKST